MNEVFLASTLDSSISHLFASRPIFEEYNSSNVEGDFVSFNRGCGEAGAANRAKDLQCRSGLVSKPNFEYLL